MILVRSHCRASHSHVHAIHFLGALRSGFQTRRRRCSWRFLPCDTGSTCIEGRSVGAFGSLRWAGSCGQGRSQCGCAHSSTASLRSLPEPRGKVCDLSHAPWAQAALGVQTVHLSQPNTRSTTKSRSCIGASKGQGSYRAGVGSRFDRGANLPGFREKPQGQRADPALQDRLSKNQSDAVILIASADGRRISAGQNQATTESLRHPGRGDSSDPI